MLFKESKKLKKELDSHESNRLMVLDSLIYTIARTVVTLIDDGSLQLAIIKTNHCIKF
jgi:hypothetical protein